MTPKLSEASLDLLTLVNDNTEWEGDERPGRTLKCYFVPKYGEMWSNTLKRFLIVSGGGDAARFRALEARTLIQRQGSGAYYYSITEEGLQVLAGRGQN